MSKLLVVDDDEFVQEYHSHTLSDQFELEMAMNGREALERVESFEPDLILMDIKMPELNGYDAAKLIRKKDCHVPILFLSKLSSLDERLHAYDAGGNDFIAKPASPDEIIQKVKLLLSYPTTDEQQEANMAATRAMTELSYLGQIVGFYRSSYQCQSLAELATAIFEITTTFGLTYSLVFREEQEQNCYFSDGLHKPLDLTLLHKS